MHTLQCERTWVQQAISKIHADFNRSADTHLIKVPLPFLNNIDLYLKDESTHPTGSLKHRLARSLFLYGLCNGFITENTPIIEASSGSTAISEAYFARLLGIRFIAVVPKTTTKQKLDAITFYGGEYHLVEPTEIYTAAQQLANSLNGHYMDQFTFAERVTDWRGNNNIAESMFKQMQQERFPAPQWVVASAGTGGTSATIGRYIRYSSKLCAQTKLCVVDPENSVFFDSYKTGNTQIRADQGSRIEGIGRPKVEASFIPTVIDKMLRIPDAASIATIWWLEGVLGRKCGGSTGTNLYGALYLIADMIANKQQGSVVSLICDTGQRYADSYYNEQWLIEKGLNIQPYLQQLDTLSQAGKWDDSFPLVACELKTNS